MSAKD